MQISDCSLIIHGRDTAATYEFIVEPNCYRTSSNQLVENVDGLNYSTD